MESLTVTADQLNEYNPERFDARANPDGTYTLYPVLWWDDASYAAYQSGGADQYDD